MARELTQYGLALCPSFVTSRSSWQHSNAERHSEPCAQPRSNIVSTAQPDKINAMRHLSCLLLAIVVPAIAAVPTPRRELTDPHSLSSLANSNAAPVPIADLFYARGNGGIGWSPDGRQVVISTNFSGRLNLWQTSAEGNWPVQLAHSDNRQIGAAWSPDGKWIVFESDAAGNELFDLFAIPARGGATVNLTDSNDASETAAHWSPDARWLAFERKLKDAPATDIALFDWSTRKVRALSHEATADHIWQLVSWSNDGRSVYANRSNAASSDSSGWRIDVASGEAEELTPHKGEAVGSFPAMAACWSSIKPATRRAITG